MTMANPTLIGEAKTDPIMRPATSARKKMPKSRIDSLKFARSDVGVGDFLRSKTATTIIVMKAMATIVKKPVEMPGASNVGFGGS